MDEGSLSKEVVDAAISVHRALGPGLLESAYGAALQIELKAVATLEPIHASQVLTYLRLSGLKLGLLMNFNCALMKDGIRRIANGL